MGKKKKTKEKPLEKMTSKELREVAMEMEEITGIHGMNKAELVHAIKKAKGIEDTTVKQSGTSIREVKQKIRTLKTKREKALEADDKKMSKIYRNRIAKLKKKTRKVA